jgi:hypothetical protein
VNYLPFATDLPPSLFSWWQYLFFGGKHKIRCKDQQKVDDLLARYRATNFLKLVDEIGMITEMNTEHMLATLECIKFFEDGHLEIIFLDGYEVLLQGR